MNRAYIKYIEYYLPEKIVTNSDLVSEFPEWSVDKIESKTGISQRHVVENQTSGDLAFEAANKLLSNQGINKADIDFILLCTQSPDYFLPTTACVLQHRLGLDKNIGALDFNLGCSGFVYGLSLAKGLIETGQATNILLLTAETYSKYLHKHDKSVRTIFGDGAAATLVSSKQSDKAYISKTIFGSDGAGAKNLIVKQGAAKSDFKRSVDNPDAWLSMTGSEIFTFTLITIPKAIKQCLKQNNLDLEQIDLFVFHQANGYMLEHLRKKMGIDKTKFFVFLKDVGNTVSATIPIALKEAQNQTKIKQGDKIMIVGFGVGYSWAASIIEF